MKDVKSRAHEVIFLVKIIITSLYLVEGLALDLVD